MTPTSLLPKAAAAVGLTFEALVAELVRLGLAAHAKRTGS
jgi:D-alanine-D-alanine ligase-like ATP-grasp enzyme